MSWGQAFLERVAALAEEAAEVVGDDAAATLQTIRERLDEPLRVAIAGKVKAGKSTLLNALVGEKLAPTDAGECTKIVTWYREGRSYEVSARLRGGKSRPLSFDRDGGALTISLGDLTESDVEYLEVRWPSSRLRDLTLVDTPGIEGMDEGRSARTRELFGLEDSGHSEVDAVIYLMRHLHQQDAAFLETFLDRSVAQPSPVNAVGVLSRADEIGAGRLDALISARAIANRYAKDARLRALSATVVAIGGLAAETGRTLREEEAETLQLLAELEEEELEGLLLSADRFCDPQRTTLSFKRRKELLDRFGMFGLRFALDRFRSGAVATGSGLSAELVEVSGIDRLTAVLDRHFRVRSRVLRARSALSNLKALARDLSEAGDPAGAVLLGRAEKLESSAHELAELRLTALLLTGEVVVGEEEGAEIGQMLSDGTPAERLGEPEEQDPDRLQTIILARVQQWRARGAHPLADASVAEAAEIMARSYEGLHTDIER